MTQNRTIALASLKKIGRKKKIPQHTLEALCRVIRCEMDGKENPVKETSHTHLKTTIQVHREIGFETMMRGFLAQEWMEALIQQGVPSPEKKMNVLHNIIRTEIVYPIWQERNYIKHGKNGIHNEREAETLNNRIKWFIDHQYEVLSYGDRLLAETNVSLLQITRTVTKKRWLRHLDLASKIYERE